MKYFTSQGDSLNAKKYWLLSKDQHALLNPADSHETIALLSKKDLGFAFDMFTYLCENHTNPHHETFKVMIESHTKEKLFHQVKHLEKLHSRCYN